jgi:dolichyl-phosphate-mannose--protein O-mannosyl transferase
MTFLAPPIQMFLHHLQRFIIQHWIVLALIAIGFCGSFLHIVSIAYPDTPVFDEAHFATYSSQYATGRMPIDIHPPLGKLIYAGVLTLVDPLRLHLYDFFEIGC